MTDAELEARQGQYANFPAFVYYERLSFCGCGDPGAILDRMREALQQITEHHPPYQGTTYSLEAVMDHEWRDLEIEPLMLYVLDAADLTDHGGNIEGCWLTDDGERFLAAFVERGGLTGDELIDERRVR